MSLDLMCFSDVSNFSSESFAESEVAGGSQVFGKQIGIRRSEIDKVGLMYVYLQPV